MSDPKPQPSEPTVAQIAAMIGVLGDDRGPLQESARKRLLAWGELAVPQLREGAEAEHMSTRTRCRSLLRAIEVRAVLRRFGELQLDQIGRASAPGLLEGAVLAARMVRTFVPETRSLAAQLRREAGSLRRECDGRSLPTCARLLAERLHDQLGLTGCDADQLDVDHVQLVQELFERDDIEREDIDRELIDRVLIDRVMASKVGAPIALSLIYLLVARWAGLSAAGVALPDHFLVRLHGPRPLLLDPFHGGRVVTKADCARYLRSNGYDRVREHLRDLNDREVLIRYLRSLRAANRRSAPDAHATLGEALDLLETS